jgi:hypothetical protein
MKVNSITQLLLICAVSCPARAWHSEGHSAATDLAVTLARDIMPAFFTQGLETIKHCSIDPDVFKIRADSSCLYRTEYPSHYFDLELFEDVILPDTREDFWWWCLRHKVSVGKIGALPYAIAESSTRLSLALAEHQRWPENEAIQAKCLVYAGLLAHYAQDACMPLHATIHWDGRSTSDNNSPRTGIHTKTDALLHKIPMPLLEAGDPNDMPAFDSVLEASLEQLRVSNSRVDQLYLLEPDLPDVNQPLEGPPVLLDYVEESLIQSAHFTAQLFVTAWKNTEVCILPGWHDRKETLGPTQK